MPNFSAYLFLAPPELYKDASKQLSSEFLQCASVFMKEPVSALALVSEDAAFSILDSTMELAEFDLCNVDDDKMVAYL